MYAQTFLRILCGFNISDARAVSRMDAGHRFPQHMLVVLLLIGGAQTLWLVPGLAVLCGGSCSDVPQGTQWEEKQLAATREFGHREVGA